MPRRVSGKQPGDSVPSFKRASLWTLLGTGAGQALRFGSNLILWRLLFPEAFGVMAIINSLLVALAMFSDVGVGATVVQNERGHDATFLRTAWTIQCVRGVAIAGITFGTSGWVADFYGSPDLSQFIRVAALSALFQGLTSTRLLIGMRQVNSAALVKMNLGSQIIGVGVTITWALLAPSIWSLVGGTVIAAAARVVLSHLVLPGTRDRFGWHRDAARVMFTFGRWVFISTLLTFLATQSDRLLFGKLITLADLGAYSIAHALAMIPEQVLAPLSQTVIFPLLSRARNQGRSLTSAFQKTRVPILILSGWMSSGLIVAGPAVVKILYGDRAELAQWVVPVLAVGGWGLALRQNYNAAVMALGHPQFVAASNATKVVGMLIFLPIGFYVFGFPGAVAGYSGAELLAYGVSALVARRYGVAALGQDIQVSSIVLAVASLGLAMHLTARHLQISFHLQAVFLISFVTVIWGGLFLAHRRGRRILFKPPALIQPTPVPVAD